MISIIHTLILITGLLYAGSLFYFLCGLVKLHSVSLPPESELPEIAVVVAARNEEEHIEDTVRSLSAQNYPNDRYEIVVADDRSEDHTPDILRQLTGEIANLRVMTIPEVPEGISPKKHALLTAVSSLSTPFVAATDADCTHHPDWLRAYAAAAEPSLGIATAATVFEKTSYRSWFEKAWQTMQNIEHVSEHLVTAGGIARSIGLSANGNNMVFNRTLYQNAGNEAVKDSVISGDDFFLTHTAAQRGYRLKFLVNPESRVRTVPQSTIGQTINQRARWASKVGHGSGKVVVLGSLIFVFYSGLLFYPLAVIWGVFNPLFFMVAAGMKVIPDTMYLISGYRKLGLKLPPGYYLGMQTLHIPFIFVSVVKGIFGSFTWKGGRYRR